MVETNTDTGKLAMHLGVTVQSVNRWKRGTRDDMSLSILAALCSYFNCSLDYLVGRTNSDNKTSKYTLANFGARVRELMKIKGECDIPNTKGNKIWLQSFP